VFGNQRFSNRHDIFICSTDLLNRHNPLAGITNGPYVREEAKAESRKNTAPLMKRQLPFMSPPAEFRIGEHAVYELDWWYASQVDGDEEKTSDS